MKQTAVEWLVEQICGDHTEQWQKEIEQAKEMEKEQIEIAFFKGDLFAEDYFDADNPTKDVSENYYKQTYESKTNI
jgi:hypothetical protein